MADMMYTFRFDDISVNTDPKKLAKMIAFLREKFHPANRRIMLVVSPAVHDMRVCEDPLARERTFPAHFHTQSDFRIFYKVERIGIPEWLSGYRQLTGTTTENNDISFAGHGMVHVDHRLMSRTAQELSIVMSCALLRSSYFVPPFHKWNEKTERVCRDHQIGLVKHDPTWRHLVYKPFDARNENWYFHTHDFSYEDFCARFL